MELWKGVGTVFFLMLCVLTACISIEEVDADLGEDEFVGLELGEDVLVLSPVDVKTWKISDVEGWRLQSQLEIEKTSDSSASLEGVLLKYDGAGWPEGRWDADKASGYYLALDLSGTTATFDSIGGVEFQGGWAPSAADHVLVYFVGNDDSAEESIEFVSGSDSVTVDISGLVKVSNVYTLQGDGVVDISSLDDIPQDAYCLVVPSGVTDLIDSTIWSADNVSPFGTNLVYAVIGEDCQYLGALFGVGHNNCSSYKNYRGVFEGCSSLNGLTILSELKIIGPMTFMNCSSLKSIEVQGAIATPGTSKDQQITKAAFLNCTSLEEVAIVGPLSFLDRDDPKDGYYSNYRDSIPESDGGYVNNYSSGIFYGCTSLSRIVVSGDDVTLDDYIFSISTAPGKASGITNKYWGIDSEYALYVTGHDCVVGKNAFAGSNLVSVEGWENIKSMGEGAFSSTGLSSLP